MSSSKYYQTDFPTCGACGLMYTSAALQDGKCSPCRALRRTSFVAILFWLAVLAAVSLMIGFANPSAGAEMPTLSWQRCYDHGDWRETEYCTAAAREEQGQ